MKISGSAALAATPDRVYAALNDPAVLAGTIPGCERLEALGGDRYALTVTAGVAAIKGSYDGEVVLSDPHPPSSFTLRARGSGAPGTVDATVLVRLAERDGGTLLEYDADAVVGGMVGGVGQRMISSVAKRTAGQFFSGVDDVLAGRRVAAPEAVPAPREPGMAAPGGEVPAVAGADLAVAGAAQIRPAWGAPARGQASYGSPEGARLLPVLLGAAIALAGVLVGWGIGRSRRPR